MDERGETSAAFLIRAATLYASHGIAIERVLTDNARNYTVSKAFAQALDTLGISHAGPVPTARRPTAKPNGSTGR